MPPSWSLAAKNGDSLPRIVCAFSKNHEGVKGLFFQFVKGQ